MGSMVSAPEVAAVLRSSGLSGRSLPSLRLSACKNCLGELPLTSVFVTTYRTAVLGGLEPGSITGVLLIPNGLTELPQKNDAGTHALSSWRKPPGHSGCQGGSALKA